MGQPEGFYGCVTRGIKAPALLTQIPRKDFPALKCGLPHFEGKSLLSGLRKTPYVI